METVIIPFISKHRVVLEHCSNLINVKHSIRSDERVADGKIPCQMSLLSELLAKPRKTH